MHAGPALGEELPDRRVGPERREQLDAADADHHRGGLDALVGHRVSVLELRSEQAPVGLDRLVEIVDRHAEVMDVPRRHANDANGSMDGRRPVHDEDRCMKRVCSRRHRTGAAPRRLRVVGNEGQRRSLETRRPDHRGRAGGRDGSDLGARVGPGSQGHGFAQPRPLPRRRQGRQGTSRRQRAQLRHHPRRPDGVLQRRLQVLGQLRRRRAGRPADGQVDLGANRRGRLRLLRVADGHLEAVQRHPRLARDADQGRDQHGQRPARDRARRLRGRPSST